MRVLAFTVLNIALFCLSRTKTTQAWSWQDGEVESASIAYQAQKPPEVVLGPHSPYREENNNASASQTALPPGPAQDRIALDAQGQRIAEFKEENDWKNDIVLYYVPSQLRNALPRIVQSWLRNYSACMAVYFGVSGAWAYYVYWCFGHYLYGKGNMPAPSDVYEQARVAMGSMPGYAVLPAVTEAIVELGWSRAYSRIGDVGVWQHLAHFAVYMACVEFGVYWMHRLLHDIRIGYSTLHHIHHKYNKEGSLSPFAGLAFHPIDGIIQALPYCILLMVLPMHFFTHELMLFLTGVWTTNIHDCLHARIAPIMGAGYHTIHHTTYKHNYGHYFTYMDGLFGTLVDPDDFAAEQASDKQD